MRYLNIVNRRQNCQDRAAGLTVWVSADGKAWKQVWQAREVKAAWQIDLGSDVTCSHIKIGLPRAGTLHLANVTVYGR